MKKIIRLLILFLLITLITGSVKQTYAFSSVLGESAIFPSGHVFPNGEIFPGGHLFPHGIFPHGELFPRGQLFPNGDVFINGTHVNTPFQRIIVRNNRIFLSGYAFPNVRVKLFLHSKPMTKETITDNNGYWTYELNNFPTGNHTLAMAVEDPSGSKTKSVLAATFAVTNKGRTDILSTLPSLFQFNYLTISILVISTMTLLTVFYSTIRLKLKHV